MNVLCSLWFGYKKKFTPSFSLWFLRRCIPLSQYMVSALFTHWIAVIQSLYFVNRLNWLTRAAAVRELLLRSILGNILLPIRSIQAAWIKAAPWTREHFLWNEVIDSCRWIFAMKDFQAEVTSWSKAHGLHRCVGKYFAAPLSNLSKISKCLFFFFCLFSFSISSRHY